MPFRSVYKYQCDGKMENQKISVYRTDHDSNDGDGSPECASSDVDVVQAVVVQAERHADLAHRAAAEPLLPPAPARDIVHASVATHH